MMPKPKVALNATSLSGQLTGIGTYTKALAEGLIDDHYDLRLFDGSRWKTTLPEQRRETASALRPFVRDNIPFSYSIDRSVKQRRFASAPELKTADIYHEPSIISFETDKPTIVTVHDLSWINFPESHPKTRVKALNRYFDRTLKNAAHIITDSKFVMGEIVNQFGVPLEMITPIALGVDDSIKPLEPEFLKSVRERYGLKHRSYFLLLGTLEPRKNHILAIRAYRSLPQKVKDRFGLVHVGAKGWLSNRDKAEIEKAKESGDLLALGYLPRLEVSALLQESFALIFPSIYEGFGLPVLEAMRLSTPVIGSNNSSIPEVLDGSGILFDPEDQDELRNSMLELIDDPNLYEELRRSALEKSYHFSWKNCIEKTTFVYQSILS